MAPTISVVMPVFNVERYVGAAIQSILSQTFNDFEFLIADDGSTDRSLEVVRAHAAKDPRICVITGGHQGYSRWLQDGVTRAKGHLIARMDSDDVALPHRFATQVEYLDRHPECVVVGSPIELIDPEGDVLGLSPRPLEHAEIDETHLSGTGGRVVHPTMMLRREVLTQIGGYHCEREPAEDFDLLLRLAEVGRLANVPEPLLRYRLHERSVSSQRAIEQRRMLHDILVETFARRGLQRPIPITPHMPDGWKVETCLFRSDWARMALENGHLATARKNARIGVRRHPRSIAAWDVLARVMNAPPRSIGHAALERAAKTCSAFLAMSAAARRGIRRRLGRTPVLWRMVRTSTGKQATS